MSHRQQQLASEIQRITSEVFHEAIEFPKDLLVTVLGTDISSDLKKATIRLSIFPDHQSGTGLESVRKHSGFIQRKVAKVLRIKSVPRLEFALADKKWLDAETVSNL